MQPLTTPHHAWAAGYSHQRPRFPLVKSPEIRIIIEGPYSKYKSLTVWNGVDVTQSQGDPGTLMQFIEELSTSRGVCRRKPRVVTRLAFEFSGHFDVSGRSYRLSGKWPDGVSDNAVRCIFLSHSSFTVLLLICPNRR
jgi:hypothetical protein